MGRSITPRIDPTSAFEVGSVLTVGRRSFEVDAVVAAGTVTVRSGRLLVGDQEDPEVSALDRPVSAGACEVTASIVGDSVALVRLALTAADPVTWERAAFSGRRRGEWFPVPGGRVGILDAAALETFRAPEQAAGVRETLREDFCCRLTAGDFAACFVRADAGAGPCASYWGRDAGGEGCCLVIDLGVVPFWRHDPELAPHDLAILEDADDVAAYRKRAEVYRRRGDYAQALADYADVVRLDPKDAQAHRERAWLWATCPDDTVRDGRRALESARLAFDLGGGLTQVMWDAGSGTVFFNVSYADALAAAHAEVGDFKAAIDLLNPALALAGDHDKPRLRSRLDLYRSGRPLREEPPAEPEAEDSEDPDEEGGIEEDEEVFLAQDPDLEDPEAQAHLRRIEERPEDDAPRLAYAGWLEQRGDPEGVARAEFIRVQCELARMSESDPRRQALERREKALLAQYGQRWEWPLNALGISRAYGGIAIATFRRGLIEKVSIHQAGIFPEKAEHLFRVVPTLRGVELDDFKPRALAASPYLARLSTLGLDKEIGPRGASPLAGSPHLKDLTALALSDRSLGPEGVRVWASAPFLAGLTAFTLRWSDVGDEGVRALVSSWRAPNLRALDLVHNGIGPDGAEALASSPYLTRVTTLSLGDNKIGDRGAAALLGSPHLRELSALDLRENLLGNGAAPALASSPVLARLTRLDLAYNKIRKDGVRALASSPHLARLTTLDLTSNLFSRTGACALLSSPHLTSLTSLTLGTSRLGDLGARALAESPSLKRLTYLYLGSNHIRAAGAAALAASPNFSRVETLALYRNRIGSDGARALAESPHLAALTSLSLPKNRIGPEGARALAGSPNLAGLIDLDLDGNPIGAEGARALADSPHLTHLRELRVDGEMVGAEGAEALRERFGPALRL